MSDAAILAGDFKEKPYWWEAVARPRDPAPPPPPKRADVVIVGGGLTGVAAAWELVRGGRDVVVLDAIEPGEGASSRNAGMLGRHSKHAFIDLAATMGLDTARAFFGELREIYDAAVKRIQEERLDCDFRKCGRFVGALSPAHHDKLVKEFEARARHLGEEVEFVSASEPFEVGSMRYYGGVRIIENASIQPARHYQAMRRRAEAVGARVVGHTEVTGIVREDRNFEVHTARGTVRARDVLIATNGYSGRLTPWIAKRLAPINAYMIATEPLSDNLAKSVLPAHRTYTDNRRSGNYMQLSPDGTRLLFGGRTGRLPSSLRQLAGDLYREMVFLFPQLEGVRIAHAWTGRCAATWDYFPRTGIHDGVHYSLGYCFSGNAMAPHLGVKAARRILGKADAHTFFAKDRFPRVPLIARQPWAMPALMSYYQWADRPVARAGA
jgi:glycine/D-amino acid oxidase-like deaminating enzyme